MPEVLDIDKLVRPLVRNLKPYASARDEYSGSGSGMDFLDANENPFENGVNRYPDPHQRTVKKAIARFRGVPEESLLLGNGSDEVLDLLFRVFCEPGQDAAITLPPTYGMYSVLAEINGVENIRVPLTPDFQLNVPAILEAVQPRAKLLFICSPNNPSGNSMARAGVIQLLEAFPGLVVIDEAYIDFTGEPGFAGLLGEHKNLVVTQTFSKALGMAGIRLGVCMAHPEVIGYLTRVKPPYNVNELTQQQALQGLAQSEAIREHVEVLNREREGLRQGLESISFVSGIFPSDANFLLVRVDDAHARYAQLIDKGIVVRNRSGQLHCENCLRITVGTPEENQRLLRVLNELSK
ncbi:MULTISPECIES: histidinol-phosphate transaminase [unclassified Robiginitalea]|uniref:histidinol-phosphate transaminase n=1 Tax=Robiginitalea TaxID=252306 RepID=UPI002349B6FC|nr:MULTISPECIES: histidinol-phosphate transaminase [unclassified Robiginitalea]MDC6354105.1 histidinol-phosphate transaminase [Robiginitalea sp. PM2]MDC6374372.1 histidinol-phosphate transaminase [Robiginitalea sp. SP8]